jgi:hypothetical protein
MKQYEAVIDTMTKLGGVATLGQLYQEVFKIKDCNWGTKTPHASIRRIVQQNNNIYKIKPGLYGLKSFKKELENKGILIENESNKNSKEITEFNHSYYQGLLVVVGNLKLFNTFIPAQDSNRTFLDKKLSELSSLNSIPDFSYSHFVKRSSTIDVIWFNERKMPHSFFEVEHSTNIQNSLLKFNDLQDFNTRMIIVADKVKKKEYESKIKYSSFKEIGKRVNFISYEALTKQYEALIEQQTHEIIL